MEFLGQGSDPSCSCNICSSCSWIFFFLICAGDSHVDWETPVLRAITLTIIIAEKWGSLNTPQVPIIGWASHRHHLILFSQHPQDAGVVGATNLLMRKQGQFAQGYTVRDSQSCNLNPSVCLQYYISFMYRIQWFRIFTFYIPLKVITQNDYTSLC